MKILDLLEADIPRIDTNQRPMQLSRKHKVLGQGKQGIAQRHGRDPNKVIKTSDIYTENPEQDEYVQFIKMILDHQNNPFFPRIYSAKMVYNNKTDSYQLVTTMEKLMKLDNEKFEDSAKHLFKQLGFNTRNPLGTTYKFPQGNVSNLWSWFQKPANRKKLMATTKNPQLKDAMTLLEPYIKKFGQDLHTGNIMVRLTGHGPQLVIIDPYTISSDA